MFFFFGQVLENARNSHTHTHHNTLKSAHDSFVQKKINLETCNVYLRAHIRNGNLIIKNKEQLKRAKTQLSRAHAKKKRNLEDECASLYTYSSRSYRAGTTLGVEDRFKIIQKNVNSFCLLNHLKILTGLEYRTDTLCGSKTPPRRRLKHYRTRVQGLI